MSEVELARVTITRLFSRWQPLTGPVVQDTIFGANEGGLFLVTDTREYPEGMVKILEDVGSPSTAQIPSLRFGSGTAGSDHRQYADLGRFRQRGSRLDHSRQVGVDWVILCAKCAALCAAKRDINRILRGI